jgi:hypothetical protein
MVGLMALVLGTTLRAQDSGAVNFRTAKIESVPGERSVVFDDFREMGADEPPPTGRSSAARSLWGPGGALRELRPEGEITLTSPSMAVPRNFTFELVWTGGGEMLRSFRDKEDNEVMSAMLRAAEDGKSASTSLTAGGELGNGIVRADTEQPVHFDLWARQGRVRAYLNGERLVDANQVELAPINHVTVEPSRYRPNGLRSVRLAESAPDSPPSSAPRDSTSRTGSTSTPTATG